MPIWLQTWIDRARRRSHGRPLRSTIILIGVIFLLGEIRPFAPYDWLQQSITARLNLRPYAGDITVVSLDKATREHFGQPGLGQADLARLLIKLDEARPHQIAIDRIPLFDSRSQDVALLEQALSGLHQRPDLWVELVPFDEKSARRYTREGHHRPNMEFEAVAISSKLAPWVNQVSWLSWSTPFGAPWGLPGTIETMEGRFRSLPQALADSHSRITDGQLTDLSLDPASIPKVSAIDLLQGKVDSSSLAGRRILISSEADTARDLVRTPHGSFTPRAYLIVAGAETLRNGSIRSIGWLPAFGLAAIAALLWIFQSQRFRHWTVSLIFAAIVLSPIWLERKLIFQETSNAVILLVLVATFHLIANVRSALALARSAAETKSWFLAQASHDLRQPIHAIGMLAARLAQTELSPAQADLVDKIDRSVDGASRMFQSLLDIATIESGSLKPVIVPVRVNDLFSDLEGQNALAAERRGVELRFVPCELTLLADRSLTLTMLQNVVSNAVKYASGKRVLVGCRKRGNSAALCVYDRGEGISQEDLKQVTKAFFRASRGNAGAEGTGLGLAIVHRLADLMDLRFDIRSNPGRGTGVMISGFRLGEATPVTNNTPAPGVMPTPLSGMRVLLVDDDLASLRAMEALLQQWGCVVTASDHFPALEMVFDAVITDYDFGQGLTLARFKGPVAELIGRGTTVAVISGHHPDHVRSDVGEGSLLVLAKPVRPTELRAVLLAAKLRAAS